MPCVGIDGCGTALKLMSVPFVANNVMDIEGRYEEYLTQHLGQSNLHLGPTKGDVNSISLEGLERPVDMIVSGPPCPPWAGNGKHEGQADARSTVFLLVVKMIIAFIKAGKLKAAILENVRGIQSKQRGSSESFLDKLIYVLRQQELQAADYMLAQQRGNVFLRGLRTTIAPQVPMPLSPFGHSTSFLHPLEFLTTFTLRNWALSASRTSA